MKQTKVIKYTILGIIGLVVLIIGLSIVGVYNSLVGADENINLKYAEVNNALKARHDKIILIAGAVNGLQDYALDVYEMLTEARTAYSNAFAAGDMEGLIQADKLESMALTNLIAVIEDNPNLEVSSLYSDYISEVSSIESNLQYTRRQYNLAVSEYKEDIRKFPRNLFASLFGFSNQYDFWQLGAGEGDLPVVDFS